MPGPRPSPPAQQQPQRPPVPTQKQQPQALNALDLRLFLTDREGFEPSVRF